MKGDNKMNQVYVLMGQEEDWDNEPNDYDLEYGYPWD